MPLPASCNRHDRCEVVRDTQCKCAGDIVRAIPKDVLTFATPTDDISVTVVERL